MLGARTCTQTKKRVPRFLILEALLKLREMISYGCFDHQVSQNGPIGGCYSKY